MMMFVSVDVSGCGYPFFRGASCLATRELSGKSRVMKKTLHFMRKYFICCDH
jgi:hypothetical protein